MISRSTEPLLSPWQWEGSLVDQLHALENLSTATRTLVNPCELRRSVTNYTAMGPQALWY